MSDYLTTSEAALKINRSVRFIVDELRRKNLRGFKYGGEWSIDPADLQVYVEAKANVRPVRRVAS